MSIMKGWCYMKKNNIKLKISKTIHDLNKLRYLCSCIDNKKIKDSKQYLEFFELYYKYRNIFY